MSVLVTAGPFCAGQTPPVTMATLAHSAPTFDFCSSGQVIQYLNPINMQKQIFTVPYTPSLPTWEELVGHYVPAAVHPAVPPTVAPPVVIPVVDPVVIDPPVTHDGDDCHHNPPPTATPEPGTYGLMFAGGSFLVVLGAKRKRT